MTKRKVVKKQPIEEALKLAYRVQIGLACPTAKAQAIVKLEEALMLVMGVEAYDDWCDDGTPVSTSPLPSEG